MSDNGDKTTPLIRMITTFEIGSYRLTDMIHGGATYFEDTGNLRFASIEHWERHEERYRGKMLKDSFGDVWAYINGKWRYWCGEGDGHWCDGATIGDYAEGGFIIVDDQY